MALEILTFKISKSILAQILMYLYYNSCNPNPTWQPIISLVLAFGLLRHYYCCGCKSVLEFLLLLLVGVNAFLVSIFWSDFYFSPYILFLPLLVPKPINIWYLSSYRYPINRKCWRGWRHSKIIIKKIYFDIKKLPR